MTVKGNVPVMLINIKELNSFKGKGFVHRIAKQNSTLICTRHT